VLNPTRTVRFFGFLILGIALGAGAGVLLWYSPAAASPTRIGSTLQTTPLTAAPAPMVDSSAPDFSLAGLDGRTTTLADLRGKAAILNFWATWCDPCRAELPLLDRIARTYAGSLTVLAVDTGEPENDVRAFAESLGLSELRVLLDPAGQVRDLYLVRGYPTTFFVDSGGVIRRIKIGTLNSVELESILNQMGVIS
jgi:thiol-disulfide isomerase/thioredoxin